MLVLQTSKKFCPNARIVRCEDYAVFEQVKNIIEVAKEKRKKLLDQADLQIRLLRENAQKEIDELKKEVEVSQERQLQQRKIELLFSMLGKGIEFFSSLESVLVQTLKSLFLKILGECPPEERMYQLVKNTIKTLPNGKFLHVSVHPDQTILINEKIKELKALQPSLERIEVIASKTLALDECILETETGIFDAGVTVQLESLIKAIQATLH